MAPLETLTHSSHVKAAKALRCETRQTGKPDPTKQPKATRPNQLGPTNGETHISSSFFGPLFPLSWLSEVKKKTQVVQAVSVSSPSVPTDFPRVAREPGVLIATSYSRATDSMGVK